MEEQNSHLQDRKTVVGMILEGIVTTKNDDQSVNIAPMGPRVDLERKRLILRPFPESRTCHNLIRRRYGVFHVIDDVLLLASAAIGRVDTPLMFPAEKIDGMVLKKACRWYEFEVQEIDDSNLRTEMTTRVIHQGHLREFFGFNRAKHAVVEAAILATRVKFTSRETIADEFRRLLILVEKTGGKDEHQAFELLQNYVQQFPDDKVSLNEG